MASGSGVGLERGGEGGGVMSPRNDGVEEMKGMWCGNARGRERRKYERVRQRQGQHSWQLLRGAGGRHECNTMGRVGGCGD